MTTTTDTAAEVHEGEIDGARFRVEVPARGHGTLVLWSQSPLYTAWPGQPVPVAPDPRTRDWLLDSGYTLAASNYRAQSTAAELDMSIEAQLALLDRVDGLVGEPRRVIAWGSSAGGLMSVLMAERHADRVDGALSAGAPLAGLAGLLDLTLDYAHAVTRLLDARDVPLVGITDPDAVGERVRAVIAGALGDPVKRARLALASALADVVGWARALQPRPADTAGVIDQQAQYGSMGLAGYWTATRAQIEARLGGNPSGNTEVDYRRQFERSTQHGAARAAYAAAGLDLDADLDRLNAAPRVSADASAAARLAGLTPTGRLNAPVLTMHTVGDGLVPVEHESVFAGRVEAGGRGDLLRRVHTDRGGHCCHTVSEYAVALRALEDRVTTGDWGQLDPGSLNAAARELGPGFRSAPDWGVTFQPRAAEAAFFEHTPGGFPRG
ncbi:hypothetical protein [Phytomonospora endophytica]|uniref:Alpha/beta hydrolase n=1 Tax=Phytomonospora endophytica TaxID=714109 RepID=A0A841G1E1_9ACTN|nr:hypothetical protein [Phytomonospora endophytica]MBB6037980.1 hypothetical protein [Phytomonospora endophytica]GIG68879.1 alpha/beta hydrolase [Phytomonospora endophytica]